MDCGSLWRQDGDCKGDMARLACLNAGRDAEADAPISTENGESIRADDHTAQDFALPEAPAKPAGQAAAVGRTAGARALRGEDLNPRADFVPPAGAKPCVGPPARPVEPDGALCDG